jgi:hypothetical protein
LITACVAGVALAFLLWNPYAQVTTLSLEYVRGQAVKWARCIEERTPFTLDVPALVSQETVTIRVDLPNEQPLVVTCNEVEAEDTLSRGLGWGLVYGPPTTWSGERRAKVYQEEGFVVVELVPRVQIMASSESGAKVYIVRVELFRLDLSQVEARKTIGPKGVQELPYARGYDYSGTSSVYLNNELVGQLSVVKGDG